MPIKFIIIWKTIISFACVLHTKYIYCLNSHGKLILSCMFVWFLSRCCHYVKNGFASVSQVDWAASLCGCQPTLGYCQQVFNIQQGSFRSLRLLPPATAVQEGLDNSGQSPVEAWFKPILWTQQLYGHREWLQSSENQLMTLAQTGKAC